jgi:hypothetical protein
METNRELARRLSETMAYEDLPAATRSEIERRTGIPAARLLAAMAAGRPTTLPDPRRDGLKEKLALALGRFDVGAGLNPELSLRSALREDAERKGGTASRNATEEYYLAGRLEQAAEDFLRMTDRAGHAEAEARAQRVRLAPSPEIAVELAQSRGTIPPLRNRPPYDAPRDSLREVAAASASFTRTRDELGRRCQREVQERVVRHMSSGAESFDSAWGRVMESIREERREMISRPDVDMLEAMKHPRAVALALMLEHTPTQSEIAAMSEEARRHRAASPSARPARR